MCLGIPMQVLQTSGTMAICGDRDGQRHDVSTALLDAEHVVPGTRVLVHCETAIRILDEEEARLIEEALLGLEAANEGRPIDAYFADLISREPELPPHLRAAPADTAHNETEEIADP